MKPDNPSRPQRLLRWLPPLLWAAVIFLLSSQSRFPGPADPRLDTLLEIAAHAGEFAILALLLRYALAGTRALASRASALAWLAAAAYAATDELHQAFVPGRHADPWDWVVDAAAAALALLLWRRFGSRHR